MSRTGYSPFWRPPVATGSTLHAAARLTDANQTSFTSDDVSWDDYAIDTDGYLTDPVNITIPAGLSGWYVVEAEIQMSLGNIALPASHHQAPQGVIFHFHFVGSTTTTISQDTFYQPLVTEYVPNSVGGILRLNTGIIGCADGDQIWANVDTDSLGETLGGGGWCHMSILKVG